MKRLLLAMRYAYRHSVRSGRGWGSLLDLYVLALREVWPKESKAAQKVEA